MSALAEPVTEALIEILSDHYAKLIREKHSNLLYNTTVLYNTGGPAVNPHKEATPMGKPTATAKRKRLPNRRNTRMTSVILREPDRRAALQAAARLHWTFGEVIRTARHEWLTRNGEAR